MIFANAVELWEMKNNKRFYEDWNIHPSINKETLLDYLLLNFDVLRTIDSHSETFHFHTINFFDIHKFNIDKLAETTLFTYEPLEDYTWHQVMNRDTTQDETTGTTQKVTDDATSSTVEQYSEDGTSNDMIANLVSAFNDIPSNPPNYQDTEHDRKLNNGSYDKNGDRSIDFSSNEVTDLAKDEERDYTENVGEDITRHGNDKNTFQQLINEERAVAEFNIYKWIGRHFQRELLTGVWM